MIDDERRDNEIKHIRSLLLFDQICCINLKRRPDRWKLVNDRMQAVLGEHGRFLWQKMERSEAVDGVALSSSSSDPLLSLCRLEWDASNNARWDRHILPPFQKKLMTSGEIGCAISHVQLWRKLVQVHHNVDARSQHHQDATMLILEDDVVFYPGKNDDGGSSKPGSFVKALSSLVDILPTDWDILYLGFCNFGPKKSIVESSSSSSSPPSSTDDEANDSPVVQIFRPTYGFYTHAYAIRKSAASRLLQELPVAAPLDVWLADNDWFGLNVYVSGVVQPNGKTVSLIAQRRVDSDIVHSAHHANI